MKTKQLSIENRKAFFDYFIKETYEAGIVLSGAEVKAIRHGLCQLKGSYIRIINGELFLFGTHISPAFAQAFENINPERDRKLLMQKAQIRKLDAICKQDGYTLVPLRVYSKNNRIKVEIGLVKGKKKQDKRESLAKRDVERKIAQALKER